MLSCATNSGVTSRCFTSRSRNNEPVPYLSSNSETGFPVMPRLMSYMLMHISKLATNRQNILAKRKLPITSERCIYSSSRSAISVWIDHSHLLYCCIPVCCCLEDSLLTTLLNIFTLCLLWVQDSLLVKKMTIDFIVTVFNCHQTK